MQRLEEDPESERANYKMTNPVDGGRPNVTDGKTIDYSWLAPYRIDSDVLPKATKYLFKYVSKGNEKEGVSTEINGETRKEIDEGQDLGSEGFAEVKSGKLK